MSRIVNKLRFNNNKSKTSKAKNQYLFVFPLIFFMFKTYYLKGISIYANRSRVKYIGNDVFRLINLFKSSKSNRKAGDFDQYRMQKKKTMTVNVIVCTLIVRLNAVMSDDTLRYSVYAQDTQ